jgi:hypothetical protein
MAIMVFGFMIVPPFVFKVCIFIVIQLGVGLQLRNTLFVIPAVEPKSTSPLLSSRILLLQRKVRDLIVVNGARSLSRFTPSRRQGTG